MEQETLTRFTKTCPSISTFTNHILGVRVYVAHQRPASRVQTSPAYMHAAQVNSCDWYCHGNGTAVNNYHEWGWGSRQSMPHNYEYVIRFGHIQIYPYQFVTVILGCLGHFI